jgi:6,7-dimethyl-8-ribityllumazine synthase
MLEAKFPIAFGVLTTETLAQAMERSGGAVGNKGEEAVETVIEMVTVLRQLKERAATLRSRARTPMSY